MVPTLRRQFNERFIPEQYARLRSTVEGASGAPVGFRICETPCFFERRLLDELAATGTTIVRQLLDDLQYRRASDDAILPASTVPGETDHPLFLQVDFGLVRTPDGRLEPKLVDLQGSPSLYAFQRLFAALYRQAYDLPRSLGLYLGGMDDVSYNRLLRDVIAGDHDPEQVVILDVDPRHQKTLPDDLLTESLTGIRTVDVLDVIVRDRRLHYRREDGELVPIARIYNRAIAHQLVRDGVEVPFDWRDDYGVEWAGHPNWAFRLSKFAMPFLNHPSVPRARFLDEVETMPPDREHYVLRSLTGRPGSRIVVAPTDTDLAAIPADRRHDYILQERLSFAPVIDTPHGPTQVEVRVMYIWRDEMLPVLPLLRMGRGTPIDVDHTGHAEWVGASAALIA